MLGILKNLFRVLLRRGEPRMAGHCIAEIRIGPKFGCKEIDRSPKIREHLEFLLIWCIEVDVILMWAKVFFTYEFRNGDLRVNRTAKRFIPLPLKGRYVVWRRRRQGDNRWLSQTL